VRAQFEKIHSLDKNAFHAYTYEKAEFDSPWHYHPEFELTYILSSQGVRYAGNSVENFEENDLVLLGPNLPHCWKNTGTQKSKAGAIVIHWNNTLLGSDWLKQLQFDAIHALLQRSSKGIKFEDAAPLKEKLLDMLEQQPFQKFVSFLDILNDLSTAKARLLCERGFYDEPDHDDHERINRIYQYVRKEYKQKISLANASEEIHMTEESFSRFFSRLMGKPFFTFLNEYRINAASKMLIESDLDVSQVAWSNGFESLPFFYRQFKRYKGKSPGQYRAMFQKMLSK